jgi:hypothetical protein
VKPADVKHDPGVRGRPGAAYATVLRAPVHIGA